MLPLPPLPIEIRDAIIDEVASEAASNSQFTLEYRQTLLSFHAASTDTRHRALKHIYKKLCITNVKKAQARIKALRDLIEPPTRIGGVDRYIKDVVFHFTTMPFRKPISSTRSAVQDLMEDQNLIFILRNLRGKDYGPEKISLFVKAHYGPWPPTTSSIGPCVEWTNLSPEFRSAFQNLIHSPYLIALHVTNVAHLPISTLECPRLKDLSIYQYRQEFVEDTDRSAFMGYPLLERLNTNYLTLSPNPNRMSPSFFHGLKELVIESRREDRQVALQEVLQNCGETLDTLKLNILGSLEFDIQSLGEIPNLKVFTITQGSNTGTFVGNIQHLVSLLNVSQPMGCLEEIDLDLSLMDENGAGPFMNITHPAWEMIDAILSSTMYPNLRKLDISINAMLTYLFYGDFDEVRFTTEGTAYLARQFHRLASSNMSFHFKLDCISEVIVGHREHDV